MNKLLNITKFIFKNRNNINNNFGKIYLNNFYCANLNSHQTFAGVKNVHSSSTLNIKLFVEHENSFAYQIIEKTPKAVICKNVDNPNTSVSLNIDDFNNVIKQNWDSLSPNELTNSFVQIAEYAKSNQISLSDTIFDPMIVSLLKKCRELSDENIYDLLKALERWPDADSINSRNFGDLWSALDDMCLERFRKWEVEKLFSFAELWYKLKLGRVSQYMHECLDRIATRKYSKLTPKQFVKFMFFINIKRVPADNMFDIETQFGKVLDQLTINEIAVVCMAYFKTKTGIRDVGIVAKIVQRVVAEIDTVHEISLCAVLKLLRLSQHLPAIDQIKVMLDNLTDQIERLSLLACVHIALVGTNALLFHPETLTKIVDKFIKNIEIARLKDIERIAFVISLYNLTPLELEKKNFFEILKQELYKREKEINTYPRCLTSCLHYLSIRQIYLLDLISRVLDQEFLKKTYGKTLIGRDLYHLDMSLDIDIPQYDGNRLTNRQRLLLCKQYTQYPPIKGRKTSATNKILIDVFDHMAEILGSEQYLDVKHVLPQYERADIIFALQKTDNRPVHNVAKYLSNDKYYLSDIKKAVNLDELEWFAIVIGGWNCFIRGTNQLLGIYQMKLRHLEMIGYHPIVVVWHDWITLSYENKRNYLKNLIKNYKNDFR